MRGMERLLLHICCAPCSVYPVKRLKEKGYDVRGYFFNPNIHPYTEFRNRFEAALKLESIYGIPVEVDRRYGLGDFLRATGGDAGKPGRCLRCYELRIRAAARFAGEKGYSHLTTTLLYSIHQMHEQIAQIAGKICSENLIEFLYVDFRIGWRDGVVESREKGLYRQKYCGCIFSEYERFGPKVARAG